MKYKNLKCRLWKALKISACIPALSIVMLTGKSFAQQYGTQNKSMHSILKPSSEEGWLEFKEESSINPLTVFSGNKNVFSLGANDEMRLVKTENDELGMTHYRYQQYYNGVKIKGAEYIVHANNGKAVSANGKIFPGLALAVNPTITEGNALNEALKKVESKKYMWLNAYEENRLKERRNDNQATYYPHGELVFTKSRTGKETTTENLILCWQFDIHVEDGLSKSVFIDAITGSVVNTIALDMICNQSTGNTTFNGTQSIWSSTSGGNFILYEDCGSPEFHVRNANTATDLSNVTEYIDANNIWNDASQLSPMQSYFGLRQTYWFYKNTYNRNSYDNSGSDIEAYNNAWFVPATGPNTPNNASWSGSDIVRFGPGNSATPTDDYNSNDVVGHEFTHGVTGHSADLDYQDESGALNESFSDIFGEMVEKYIEGSMDFLMGNDMSTGYLRNMTNPNDKGDPDTYLGTNWYTGTADNGGVHTNSGVQNFCFYLLSQGGSGTNDLGKAYTVTGIGPNAAAAIAYRALTVYLSSGSQYINARAAWIHAAIDLYGSCSNAAIQTGNAWHAVGVESQSAQYVNDVCGSLQYIYNTHFQAIGTLIGANSCINTIQPNIYSVKYSSSDQVLLKTGFTALAGSHFTAYVEPCAATMYKTSNASMNDYIPEAGTTSEKLSTEYKDGNSLLVSPSPFNDHLKLKFNLTNANQIVINIYDLPGRKSIEEFRADAIEGRNEISINTSSLKAGVYFVEMINGSEKTIRKIVKGE